MIFSFVLESLAECNGVILEGGTQIFCPKVIITTGTFLRGEITLGLDKKPAGRKGDQPAVALAETLDNLGFQLGRLKTGKIYTISIFNLFI